MEPVLMPSIKSCPFDDEVTETVVLGQRCTSPVFPKLRTAVSVPAVIVEPGSTRLPANMTAPNPPGVTGTSPTPVPSGKPGRDGASAGGAGSFTGGVVVAVVATAGSVD